MRRLFLLIAASLWLSAPLATSAHGLGQSFKKEVGGYTVEFEYEEPEIIENEAAGYVFRLLEKDSGQTVVFDSVFVAVEDKESRTVVAARIGQDKIQDGVGRATLALNAGDYKFNLSFQKGDETLAEASFDQKVEVGREKQKTIPTNVIGGTLLGLIAGFGIAKFLGRGKKNAE